MPAPTHTSQHKFLIDENVRHGLYQFLKRKSIDVKLVVKGSSDKELARISKSEKRILITNDEDFSEYTKDKIYSVIWLRISQSDESALLNSFDNLLPKIKDFSSKLTILYKDKWDVQPLND